ncbi:MAG: hypothetical protein QXZ48_05685 [Zestosphaera sp.]
MFIYFLSSTTIIITNTRHTGIQSLSMSRDYCSREDTEKCLSCANKIVEWVKSIAK